MSTVEITSMPVWDLVFDRQNPRLSEFDLGSTVTEEEVLTVLWNTMDVRELVMSIAASGFFRHEPLIVLEADGKNIVLEGNRRLAAVRVLLDPALIEHATGLPPLTAEAKSELRELPVMKSTRKDAWRYLGFKHLNGPVRWRSYARARYIADIHRNFGIGLADIAEQLGDRHQTVQQLFRSFMVLEEAEQIGAFQRADRWHAHFSFTHLYTGIAYPGISEFICLRPASDENPMPVPIEKKGELQELCRWMYGSKREEIAPVIETHNPHLRQLDAVVANRVALAALRAGQGLASAFELSRPSLTVFEEAFLEAKRSLHKALGMRADAYDGSEELLKIAGSVANMADSLYYEMERQRRPWKRHRLTEDG